MWEKSRGSSSLLSDTNHPKGYEPSVFLTVGRDVGESVRKGHLSADDLRRQGHRSFPILLL